MAGDQRRADPTATRDVSEVNPRAPCLQPTREHQTRFLAHALRLQPIRLDNGRASDDQVSQDRTTAARTTAERQPRGRVVVAGSNATCSPNPPCSHSDPLRGQRTVVPEPPTGPAAAPETRPCNVDAFLLLGEYLAPLDVIEQVRPAHRTWLGTLQESGHLVLAGRRLSKTGSVVIVLAESEGSARMMSAGDPYVLRGVSRYDVIPFEAGRWGVTPPEPR